VLNQLYWRLITTSNAKNVLVSPRSSTPRGAHHRIFRVSTAPPTASCWVDHFHIANANADHTVKYATRRTRKNGVA
jgi:hypothetical protein